MPLNKFVPLSPDPYITSDPEMTLAKFGHLNTIVDYLNGTNALTNIKIAGINNTAGYIDFSANPTGSTTVVGAIRTYVNGVNLSEVMTFREDGNVGVGTTSPTARLRVISADTNGIAEFFQNGFASSPLHLTRYTGLVGINLNTAAGGSASPVPVGDNIQMSRLTTNTYNGTGFGVSARIEVVTKGIQSATNYGSIMRFLTTPENTTSTNEVLSLLSDGNVQIGSSYTIPLGAKLGIKGSGSTSATTSLLVQNSSSSPLFNINDAGEVCINGTSTFGYKLLINGITWLNGSTRIDGNTTLNGLFTVTAGTILTGGRTVVRDGNSLLVGGSPGLDTPDPSALTEIRTTIKGFLPPRVTTLQKNAIATPATGLQVHDTDLNRPCFYNGTSWVTL